MLYKPDWDQCAENFTAWWKGDFEKTLLQVWASKPGMPPAQWDGWDFARKAQPPGNIIEEYEKAVQATHFLCEAFPNQFLNMGPGAMASFYTGFMEFNQESSTVWFEQPKDWDAVESYRMLENEHWDYITQITRISAERGEGKWITGVTDIGLGLDILASFRGAQELLMDCIAEPERVARLQERVRDDWPRVYDSLQGIISKHQTGSSAWTGLWCEGTWYPLQCDFSAMISPAMFEQYVVEDLASAAAHLDHSLYHLDGPGQLPHVDLLLDIPGIDAIQWVPGTGNPQNEAEQWYPLYEKILGKGKRLILQCWDDFWQAPEVVKRFGEKNIMVSAFFATLEEAERFIAEMGR